jgi:Mg2+-importing ATPase
LAVELHSSPRGLGAADARRRLARYGRNALEAGADTRLSRLLVRQFTSPLVLILLAGAAISTALREWTEAAIILAVVLGSALLGAGQEWRASTAVAALRRRLALHATAWRDGVVRPVPVNALVPGDVVLLSAGKLVPADGVILAATDFLVSEASLTGEPFPVEKRPGTSAPDAGLAARLNCVYAGTSVRSGTATVLVVHTGAATEVGRLATRLQAPGDETEFARGLRHFGILLLRVMLFTVVAVLVMNQLLQRPVVESLLFAVALAVGLSPELLPAIVSVTLSRGAREMARRGVIVRRPDAIEDLGSMDVLCTDKTGTLTAGVVVLSEALDAQGRDSTRVRELAFINATLESGIENPLDAALVEAGRQAGYDAAAHVKIDEIPYDFIRKRLTIVIGAPGAPGEHLMVTKGAFDRVLAVCTRVAADGDGPLTLDDTTRARLRALAQDRGTAGFRVLAVATRRVPARAGYGHADESDMTLEGLLLFFDPPKPQARQALADLGRLGIAIKVITGDSRHVAAHVAQEVGLDATAMLTGEQVAALNDEALWHRAPRTALFVEVDPQQKERIVRALQTAGHTVGYLGDGINDAPALRAADVGLSVDSAVDVARESADIVLLRPDLDVLRQGVEQGRITFANTLKYIGITTSANFGNMMSMAVATPLLPFLPLLAKQILLNNFLSDLPSMTVSTDRVDRERIEAPQRWNLVEVRRFMVVFGLVSSVFDLLTFWLLLRVFHADEATFRTMWFLVSLLTELAVVLVLRTQRPAWRSLPSPVLLATTLAAAVVAFSLPYLGPVARLFGFVPLPLPLLGAAALVVLAYIGCTEWAKGHFYRHARALR